MIKRVVIKQKREQFVLGIGLLALLLAPLMGCEWRAEPETAIAALRPVRTERVRLHDQAPIKRFYGVTEPVSTYTLSFATSGLLLDFPVGEGARVKAGELIAQLDQEELLSELSQSRTALARAEAEFRNAETLYERVTALIKENKSSQSDVETVRGSLERTLAARDTALHRLRFLEDQLTQTEIISPDHCVILKRLVPPETTVRQNQPIVELDCKDSLQIRIEVHESAILSLREGAQAEVSFDALPDITFAGHVREIGSAERKEVTRFPVIIRLREAPAGLRSGVSATVEVKLIEERSHASRLLVPVNALMQEAGQTFVYLLSSHSAQERGVIKKQSLRTGRLMGSWVEVLEGVSVDDQVVTAGLQSIYDGLEVRVLPMRDGER